ncbi:MAG: CYTH domain-containing protein [Elusimicrobiaceae bacterium]|nr:CYTH domain-containing protein [Elusimicrobiaceae bacterium]
MGLEIEFKWDANIPRAFWRMCRALDKRAVKVSSPKDLSILDVYLDDKAGNFGQKNIAFRVRCVNNRWEATFKTRTEIINGKARRREETCLMPGVKNLSQALDFLNQKKCWKGLEVSNLHPLFKIKNKRKIHLLSNAKWEAELAFDTCELFVLGRRVFFKEIELEFKKGSLPLFEKFASCLTEQSGLRRARISKVKTAFSLLKLWGK